MKGSVPPRQLGGGYAGRGGGGWGRPRSVATGANDTPLGTPTRSSPLPTPVTAESPPAPKENDDAVKNTHSSVAAEKTRGVAEKGKKEKKRKSIAPDVDEVSVLVACLNHATTEVSPAYQQEGENG